MKKWWMLMGIVTAWEACVAWAEKVELPKGVPFAASTLSAPEIPLTAEKELEAYRFSGQVKASKNSELSFQVAGHIQKRWVEAGARVKKGDVLAQLDDEDFQKGLQLAESKKRLAQLQKEVAYKEYQREVQLKEAHASTGTAFDMKKSAFDQASLSVDVANVELQMAQTRLGRTQLRAPYDCIVGKMLKNEFEYVNTGVGILTVYESGHLEIHFQVPAPLLGKIQVGQMLDVKVPAGKVQGEARVIRVVDVVEEATRTFEVVGELLTPAPQLVAGLFAQAQLQPEKKSKEGK